MQSTILRVGILVLALAVLLGFVFLLAKSYRKHRAKVKGVSSLVGNKEKLSDTLLKSLPDAVTVISGAGNNNLISFFNPAAEILTGWTAADATGLSPINVFKFVDEDGMFIPETENPFSPRIDHQKIYKNNLRLLRKDNSSRMVAVIVAPLVTDNKPSGLVSTIRDVTEEYKRSQSQIEFISTASHEMRTPVAAIEGYLALALNNNVTNIDAKAREYLEKAHSSTQHLGKLFQDLLTSAKAEDGRLISHPVITEMGAFVEQLTDALKFSAEKKGLDVEFIVNTQTTTKSGAIDTSAGDMAIQPLYYVQVDPDRIREVITNLFDNAVKYTESGKISLAITGNNQVVQIRISDSGLGIPQEDVPHLFEKFYRVDNSDTRSIGGTGLGLFISRKIVELYHGKIWAESSVGKGSTFFINLPRIPTNQALQIQSKEKSPLNR